MDSIFIFGLMLVLFGPKKLPEIARQAGKLMLEFRRASNDFKLQMEEELRAAEEADRQKRLNTEAAASIATTTAALPDITTPQLAAPQDTEPTILPPSTGETISATPPNQGIIDPVNVESVLPVPSVEAAPGSAEEFYARREAELLHPEAESPAADQTAAAESETPQVKADAPIAPGTAVIAKLPGTEMYPETAPMAESDQAPTHHG